MSSKTRVVKKFILFQWRWGYFLQEWQEVKGADPWISEWEWVTIKELSPLEKALL